jgi:hypothetical protein
MLICGGAAYFLELPALCLLWFADEALLELEDWAVGWATGAEVGAGVGAGAAGALQAIKNSTVVRALIKIIGFIEVRLYLS